MSEIVKKEVAQTIYKQILNFVPGGIALDELMDLRGRIQQARLNKFAQYLKDGFDSITGKEFDPENIRQEDFLDSFEIIVRKVALTQSEEKLKRYRNVLLRKMFEPADNEMFQKYVLLIETVNETQVLILSELESHDGSKFEWDIFDGLCVEKISKEDKDERGAWREKNVLLKSSQIGNFEGVLFYTKDLVSMGLLTLSKVPAMQYHVDMYSLSVTGKGFLDFIHEYSADLE